MSRESGFYRRKGVIDSTFDSPVIPSGHKIDKLLSSKRLERDQLNQTRQAKVIQTLSSASEKQVFGTIIDRYRQSEEKFKVGVYDLKGLSIYYH